MIKRNVYNNYYNENYRNSLLNRITVNKKSTVNTKTLRLINYNRANSKNNNYKDNLYYENKNKRNKLSEEKIYNNKDIFYNNRESYKKTINTYSNDNKMKDRNIFEELQNNKYLRPMLGTTNINKKLLKCKIEEPIKNICTLSLKNYFANVELPFQKCQSPQKENIDIYDEDNLFSYNINNRTVMDRFNININNEYSPVNNNKTFGDKNDSNSFIYRGDSCNFNNYLIRYSVNNIKKYSSNQLGRVKKDKNFYYKKNKEKSNNCLNKKSPKIYHKNVIALRAPFNGNNKNINKKTYNISLINNNMQRDKILLKIYKSKSVEKFVILINKFISKYFNKIGQFFFKNLVNFKNKTKIYFKKKNSRQNVKKLTLVEKNKDQILLINLQKNKSKIARDSTANFNSKSFSNEFKSSSLTSNFHTNNNINFYNQNNSYIFSEQKNKKYIQSPDDSLNKYQYSNIRKKVIVRTNKTSGSHNKIMTKSPSQFETRESAVDIFIYKKKSMNNDNLYINKNNKNNNLSYLKLNNNKYNNIITNNKKGKIIDIDINLGKPVKAINDHSPLEELFIGCEKSKLYKLNAISSKFLNINKKKKHKAKSGSKSKNKPPIKLKKFLEEDDDIFDYNNNGYLKYNRANSSMRKEKNNNKSSYFEFITFENNKLSFNKEIKKGKKKENGKLFIRFNDFPFYNKKNLKKKKEKLFKYLVQESGITIFLKKNKNGKNKYIHNNSFTPIKNSKKNKANKLYINCTKFLEKILSKLFKRKLFIEIKKFSNNYKSVKL